ncbi:FAD-binding and (Fe-S)-binding domain-containing protein [Streptomyces sp. NPDC101225]|uniref:FAD-binding and (Fe-S)-binding domain-containing protein n=1 Tax=Streptomyces sp. NPDC101225 TaxID=3366135 RepID=UPI003802DEE2
MSEASALVGLLARTAPGLEVDIGDGRRAQYAYDASNYRVPPLAVAFPRSAEDVVAVVRACRDLGIPLTARGAGTSMAGNAIGPGVVLDFSRHLGRVLSIDPAARTAVVEPGVVLDDLQRAAAPHGLFFGPDPSSHSRCTLGGMIGNDACGNHSVAYGRTVEHVEELEIVTAEGVRAVAGPGGLRALGDDPDARITALDSALTRLVDDNLAALRTELGRIPRQVSGYQLHHLLPEHGRHAARALVGTEGTCAVVTRAIVRLQTRPAATTLLALGYRDVVEAARDVPAILGHRPTAVEGMDEAIVATLRHRRGPEAVTGLPEGAAWLYVELDGADQDDADRRAAALLAELRAEERMVAGRVVEDPAERRSLWRVREDGAGLAARLVDGGTSWPGWEDAAVDPHRLADYLGDFRALLAKHGYTGVLYGHFGAGCVHVRVDFDPATHEGAAAMRAFLEEAAALVVEHGGTLSGEHGDGRARSELLAVMYSPRMRAAFAAYKRLYDPASVLNPGVIVDPAAVDADLALYPIGPPAPGGFTFPEDPGGFAEAVGRCIGVGRCRSDAGGSMCPSYRATHDERDSTRGRARLLQEMLRGGPDAVVADGSRSAEVRDALDLCLSCKACAADCPVGVDMATYKSEFLHRHYTGRLRPRSHYSLGWLPWWSALARWAAGAVNAVLGGPLGRLVARLGGVTTERALPAFAPRRALREHLPPQPEHPAAVLLVDSFTRAFRPDVAGAAARVLADAGLPATARSGLCCGLTWLTTGQLGIARRVLTRTVEHLDDGGELPIVVPEPSCAAALRHDAPALLGTESARRVAARVRSFAGALAERADPAWKPAVPDRVTLQTHCHEYAVFGERTQSELLRRLGVDHVDEANGCCGLAGNFGFEAQHHATSITVAGLSLAPKLAALEATDTVLADGFSCRTQAAHLTGPDGPQARHLAELLDPNPPGGISS